MVQGARSMEWRRIRKGSSRGRDSLVIYKIKSLEYFSRTNPGARCEGGRWAGSGAIVKIPRGLDALEIRVINRRNSRELYAWEGGGGGGDGRLKKREQRLEWNGREKSFFLSFSLVLSRLLSPSPSPSFSSLSLSRFHLSLVEFRSYATLPPLPSCKIFFDPGFEAVDHHSLVENHSLEVSSVETLDLRFRILVSANT